MIYRNNDYNKGLRVRYTLQITVCILLLIPFPGQLLSQSGPLKGVVWQEPGDWELAETDLLQMTRMGVEAIRTGIVQDERVLTLADTLGLLVFQELPVAFLPAARLLQSVEEAQRMLEPVLSRARSHPSARYFGLAHLVDTSDPSACAYFEVLNDYVHQQLEGSAGTYYTTAFAYADRCADKVDFILLDFRDLHPPDRFARTWRIALDSLQASTAGIGSMGTWTAAGSARGLRYPHSQEAQARYLEAGLNWALSDKQQPEPFAIFVYRWRDDPKAFTGESQTLDDPYGRRYGLRDDAGTRVAYDVVGGIFTGRQKVFAFSGGGSPPERFPWVILFGWGVFLMIGIFYAFSPRLRQMVPRYFKAPGFYRDAVREGRDMLLGSSSILLIALASSVGIMCAVVIETIQDNYAFLMLLRWLPRAVIDVLVTLIDEPLMIVLFVGSIYALGLVLWSTVLSVLSRRRYPLMPGQVMMLVVWPRWPLLLVMLAAMVVPTLAEELATRVALLLIAAWVLISIYAITRTLYDFSAVARVSPLLSFLAALGNPVTVVFFAAAVVAILYRPEMMYLWHLISRT